MMHSLLRLIRLFMPQWPWLLLGTFIASVSVALGVQVFVAIGLQLGAFAGGAALRLLATGRVVARYLERLLTHDATFRTIARLRLWLFRRLVPLAPLQLGMQRDGETLARLTADIDALDGLFLRLLLPLMLFSGAALLGFYWLAQWNVAATAVIAAILVVVLAGLYAIARHASPHQAAVLREQGELRAHIVDGVEGLADLMACSAGAQQAAAITRSTAALVRHQLASAKAQSLAQLLAQLLHGLLLLTLIALSWPLLANGTVEPSTLLLAILGYLGGAELLAALPAAFLAAPRLAAASRRLFELADISPLNSDVTHTQPVPKDLTLSLASVSLAYKPEALVLNDISLTIKPGERVAIMGPSGAGKSSLAMLLLKFVAPTSGSITVSTTDLSQLTGDDWRAHIGYLSQHTKLIAGSLRDNLRLAKPTGSDTEFLAALNAAELDSLLTSLPQGLDTWIGEDGLQLSGGQARRVALAMVLLKDAPIWLLDEPTEGLDSTTALAMLETVGRLTTTRTLILITHDATMLAPLSLSRLILLEDGKICSDGPI